MDLLTLATEILFALVFLSAVRAWRRRRDPVSADVVLVFAAMAGIFVIALVRLVTVTPPALLTGLSVLILLGQPVATLRLAARIHPIPRPLLAGAAAGWLGTGLPLAILGSARAPAIALAAVTLFALSELLAAWYLAAAARSRAGAAAPRLWLAAGATALFALAIVAAGAALAAPASREVANQAARIIALLAAAGYLVAFVPPVALRRSWESQAAYAGLRSLLELGSVPAGEVWRQLLGVAVASTGSAGALLLERAGGRAAVLASVGLPPLDVDPAATADRLPDAEVELEALADDPALASLAAAAAAMGCAVLRTVHVRRDGDRLSLVLFRSHRTLFGDDDRLLLTALVRQGWTVAEQRRLSEQLEATVAALEGASQAKSDFLASMSHELRTPLNAILGFSDLIRREAPAPDGSVRIPMEWVEHIHRGGLHLVELVNDVLDLSKVEAGRIDLDLERLEVLPAVTEVVAGLRPLAERKGQDLRVAVGPGEAVEADRGRLRQVLYNLLSNAIKFTPEGGRITVEGRARNGEYHLAVTDTGVGIAPEDQAAVFEEFRQVGAGAARAEGTGLGLALTRRLLEAHGGRIELESEPGAGSRFTAVLRPAPDPVPAERSADRGTGRAGAGGGDGASDRERVLVVEDDPSAVRLLRAYLEPEGYEVIVAPDGEQALELAARGLPTAILLDVLLPGIDGWEVLRRLKADPALRAIPVVIATVVDEREVGLALGAVDYLVKPIDRDALLASLGRLMAGVEAEARPVRILAVDDEPATLDMIEGTLQPAGFEVLRAPGGREGVDLARRHRPDLVICDLVMPELDGFGVVARLKDDPETAGIPIVILTAHELSASDKRRLNGQVLGIVAKGEAAHTGLMAWLEGCRPVDNLR